MFEKKKNWLQRSVETGLISVIAIGMLSGGEVMAEEAPEFELGETLYENSLSGPEDVEDWVVECALEDKGHPVITSHDGRMRMKSDAHFLLWCPKDFPDNIAVSWEFQPRVDRGLAMFWIAATGEDGKDLFDPSLPERIGRYGKDYRSGAINALHVAYFRRNPPHSVKDVSEINFQTVSLRKTTVDDNGPKMARAGDPIPSSLYAKRPYKMRVIKYGPYFRFKINGLVVIDWKDDGNGAPVLKGGKIGFRQMKGLIADYGNLRVQRVTKVSDEEAE